MPQEQSELRNAIEWDDIARVEQLLAAGHDPNFDEGYQFSLLHHAIDIEVDTFDNTGKPPDGRLVRLLLGAGADLGVRDRRNHTPLEFAQCHRHPIAAAMIEQATRDR